MWEDLSQYIEFKDPPVPVDRFLGIYHNTVKLKDGTIRMATSAKQYLLDAAKAYLDETGVSSLAYVPTPSIGDRFDRASASPGKLAKNAASHLMKLLYAARLCRGDLLVTTTFLARRISKWSLNEDRRLHRLMSYCWHHAGKELIHQLHPDDLQNAFLDYSPDAELGGDPYSTKASGGFWLELSSPCGTRKWPICFATKKAGHTSGSTADSETWSMIGANDNGLKKEVIPLLHQLEVSLNRPVKLVCKEDNTACITAIQKGYFTALRYLKCHSELSLGFAHETFFPDKTQGSPRYWAEITYWDTKLHKGDWMTKELAPKAFEQAWLLAGFVDAQLL